MVNICVGRAAQMMLLARPTKRSRSSVGASVEFAGGLALLRALIYVRAF